MAYKLDCYDLYPALQIKNLRFHLYKKHIKNHPSLVHFK